MSKSATQGLEQPRPFSLGLIVSLFGGSIESEIGPVSPRKTHRLAAFNDEAPPAEPMVLRSPSGISVLAAQPKARRAALGSPTEALMSLRRAGP